VHVRELDDQAVLTLALIENLQRADLNPIEEAAAYQELIDRFGRTQEQVAQDVRSVLGDKVYQTVIPRNVRVSEAPSHGKPVLLYDLKSTGAQAYLRLASEVIQRERALQAA